MNHPALTLPFVVDLREEGTPRRSFWSVKPTSDYLDDIRAGRLMAVEWLNLSKSGAFNAPPLAWVVREMPRDLTGVEIGFLALIGEVATSAAERGREAFDRACQAENYYLLNAICPPKEQRRTKAQGCRPTRC